MKTVLVTGAAGYIGNKLLQRMVLKDIQCIGVTRNRKNIDISDKIDIIECDISNDNLAKYVNQEIDYIVHCAAPTASKYMVTHPTEVIDVIINGTKNTLELARKVKVKGYIFLSSMEVYGQIDCATDKRISEEQLGYINVSNVRNCYPIAKIMAENMCISYFKEYDVPIKIARLAQTFGSGVKLSDNRVFSEFAKAVINNNDIVLHTTGESVGNYCDIDEVVDAIFFLFDNGKNGEIYNIVNEENTMTIREMAEMVAKEIAKNQIKVVFKIPKESNLGYAPDTGLRLSGEKMKNIGWTAHTSLKQMYMKMINSMRND